MKLVSKGARTTHRFLSHELDSSWMGLVIVICFFTSGIIDSVAFNTWNCFVAMQTGRRIQVAFARTILTPKQVTLSLPLWVWEASLRLHITSNTTSLSFQSDPSASARSSSMRYIATLPASRTNPHLDEDGSSSLHSSCRLPSSSLPPSWCHWTVSLTVRSSLAHSPPAQTLMILNEQRQTILTSLRSPFLLSKLLAKCA